MSVLKNLRGESSAEFINMADTIEVYTIEQCSKVPRRFNHTLINKIVNLSIDSHCALKSANSIYPRNKHEAQLRRDLLQNAVCGYENMGTQIHILFRITDKISIKSLEIWANMLDTELKLVRGLMRKDAERFNKLKD